MLSAMEVIIAQRLSYGFKSQQVHLSSHDDINLPGAPIVWLRQNYFTHGLAIPRLVGHYQMGLFSSPLLCTCKCLFREIYYPRKFLHLRYLPLVTGGGLAVLNACTKEQRNETTRRSSSTGASVNGQ